MASSTLSLPTKTLMMLVTAVCTGLFSSCKKADSTNHLEEGTIPLTLQLDWFAQPEYAGFYQAYELGYYKEEGLAVTIREGGPNADPFKKLLTRRCDLMNGRADKAIISHARGLPVKFVGVTMQHNPQGILSHQENPITDFKQLDQKRVMVDVAAPWIDFIEKKYNIQLIRMPHNFGLSHYLNDKKFIQQCFVTNEPFFVTQKGANPCVLPMWKSGFDIYRGVIAHTEYFKENKETIERFMKATYKGWEDYLYNDPTPAHKLIASRNSQMTPELMQFIRSKIIEYGIIDGQPNNPSNIGLTDSSRLKQQIDLLAELKIIHKKFEFSEVFPMVPEESL